MKELALLTWGASPGPDHSANWLPTPTEGNFRPILRSYQPCEAIRDGTYPMPKIIRTGT